VPLVLSVTGFFAAGSSADAAPVLSARAHATTATNRFIAIPRSSLRTSFSVPTSMDYRLH
jgi:hypothetical protein